MSNWNSYGISLTNTSIQNEVIDALENLGLRAWEAGDNVKATDRGKETVPTDDVKQALQPFRNDGVNVFTSVDANDTSDTASGMVYEANNGSWEKHEHNTAAKPTPDGIGMASHSTASESMAANTNNTYQTHSTHGTSPC